MLGKLWYIAPKKKTCSVIGICKQDLDCNTPNKKLHLRTAPKAMLTSDAELAFKLCRIYLYVCIKLYLKNGQINLIVTD